MYEGTVKKLVLDRGFGFITAPDQPDVFFHASGLTPDLEFNEQLQEQRVEFTIEGSPKGPRAVDIRAAD